MRSGAKQEREDKRSGKKRGNSKKGNRRKEEKRDEKTRGDKTREEERREKTARQSTPLDQPLAGATPRPAVQCAETPKPAVLRPPWRLPGCGNVGLVAVRHQRSVLMFFSEVRDGDIIRHTFFAGAAVCCRDCLCCACFEMVRNSSMGKELVKNKIMYPSLQT